MTAPIDQPQGLRAIAQPLDGSPRDYDLLIERVADASFVLLGESTHGTHEFYRERARITQRLIMERGFQAIAIEGDWPDTARLDRYVRGGTADRDATQAALGFRRFPTWMWRNDEFVAFLEWLREWNQAIDDPRQRVGIYGLDLYSLHASMSAVVAFLDRTDAAAAKRARERYACFDHYGHDPSQYVRAVSERLDAGCSREVGAQLVELQHKALAQAGALAPGSLDERFHAYQNARLVQNAEAYYRALLDSDVLSWNVRDRHMAETLEELRNHLSLQHDTPRIAVWAHNSHVGDARATGMTDRGEVNLGELVRERHPGHVLLVGFTTFHGTVTAADDWDAPVRRMRVLPARGDSWEHVLHGVGLPRFALPLDARAMPFEILHQPRLQRAIGVIYRPRSERLSHYFRADVFNQFDYVVHIDETQALRPLETSPFWPDDELPAAWPTGT